ncbi:hypothetical protein [Borreliella garinii]|uniref:hypothetical protein n=1 Tax=Borreliella garinii TaxID=29519 RepID=UPI001AEF4048
MSPYVRTYVRTYVIFINLFFECGYNFPVRFVQSCEAFSIFFHKLFVFFVNFII